MSEALLTEIDDRILTDVIKRAKDRKIGDFADNGQPQKRFSDYVEQLVRYATGEDRIWSEPESLLLRASAAWSHAETRKPGENKVSLRIDETDSWSDRRLILDIVTDDKPFLVDSVSAALADAGKPVSFFSNAVIDIARDERGKRRYDGEGRTFRESMIRAEMDPPVSEEQLGALRAEIETVLDDVGIAVADWEPMRARLAASIAQLERSRLPGLKSDEQREAIDFLKWLWDNRFAFLGYRRFEGSVKADAVEFVHDAAEDLGILRDPSRRILKSTYQESGEISPAVEAFLRSSEPVIVAKANTKSLVHRRVYLDYVGVKTYSIDGAVNGEDRFVGLFTSDAYYRTARDIPLIRAKIDSVLDGTDFNPGGHNEKALINILETYPRDELFQIDADTLRETALGILRLYKRPRVKLFMRRDRFDRFVSALVFIPRDRFNSDIRAEIGELLAKTFDGEVSSFSPSFGDASLVRVHFIIAIEPGAPEGPGVAALTNEIRAICRTWSDDLLDALRKMSDREAPSALFTKYERAFDAGYKERSDAGETLRDIAALEKLGQRPTIIRAYRHKDDHDDVVRLKIYRKGGPFPLSKLIPTIENLGLSVVREDGFKAVPAGGEGLLWIHDFHTEQTKHHKVELDEVRQVFEDALLATLDGRAEDDRFNGLVLTAGVNWREAALLRAAAKHHVQSGFAYSQAYMEDALGNHPAIARALVGSFHARFNPAGPKDPAARTQEAEGADAAVREALETVESLAEDRIFRRFLELFSAIQRTNYYQQTERGEAKPYISFKIDSGRITELPEPRPYREIFVSGPRIDGVHLRFGPVARGGLRWSDRPEDFRTEVLGLVKAQRVKNAVIVPTGAKGGFFPKQLPKTDDRAAIYEEGREAYKLFIRGLLDLTDNIVQGEVVAPKNMVIWDDADPYLVVAADKGTAQFSDTANAISAEYGFWLGDAFASGGSAGYDHKAMGITARGAWEAVKRHFREMGKDIQNEPFTAAGVGDMSGDVFGNGMLLSEKIKLVAAFDHRHIFIDPNPDPAKSFKERKRLFETPRTAWSEYNPKLLSKGGGVFARSAKSVALSPEIREALKIDAEKLTPNDLIKAILRAPTELFWLGGIGTYFKGDEEENWRVGDRANDAVRINASEIGAKVIGEGANLGLTQTARIEFARRGGRINTDAIDNSAGVDSSDHEVNIKILLSSAIEQAQLKPENRNELLAGMTEDVGEHVLRHNYEQTRAISQMERVAPSELDIHARLMALLERLGRLNRDIEELPNTDEIFALRQQNFGLTRPELSVLLAYAKLWLFDELVASNAPDDPIFERELFAYFPSALHEFTKPIASHRLRREIIATRMANEMIDTCGVAFVQRVAETTNADFEAAALAYEAARGVYRLSQFAAAIDGLDNTAPADLQIDLYLEASTLLREQVFRLLNDPRSRRTLAEQGVKALVQRYEAPIAEFKTALSDMLATDAASALRERRERWIARGAPEEIARDAAALPALVYALDIVDIAAASAWSNPRAGAIYFSVGRQFCFDVIRERAEREPPIDHFDKIAIRQFLDDLSKRQSRLTSALIAFAGEEPNADPAEWVEKLIAQWREVHQQVVQRFDLAIADLDFASGVSVGKGALFIREIDLLIQEASGET